MTSHKLQKSGKSFYFYVPTKWVKDNNLEKGSEFILIKDKNNINIQVNSKKKKLKIISLEIDNASPKVLETIITGLFSAGVDEFNIILKKELNKDSLNKIKESISNLGLNMIEISKNLIKLNINFSINDVNRFTKDYLYKSLNLVRLIKNNEDKELINELVKSLYYYRYLINRTIYRFKQNMEELNIKEFESEFLISLGSNLSMFSFNIAKINDEIFLDDVKELLEKILDYYNKKEFKKLLKLNELVQDLFEKSNDYFKKRVYRCLKEIIRSFTIVHFLKVEE